jgi:hypothetical protein
MEVEMKGWRTLALNVAVAAFGVLEAADWTALLGSDRAGWILVAIASANMALRTLTTTGIGRSA